MVTQSNKFNHKILAYKKIDYKHPLAKKSTPAGYHVKIQTGKNKTRNVFLLNRTSKSVNKHARHQRKGTGKVSAHAMKVKTFWNFIKLNKDKYYQNKKFQNLQGTKYAALNGKGFRDVPGAMKNIN